MTHLRWKKGIVLMQTLILSIVLATLAMMLLKWVLGRYMSVARTTRSTVARAHSQGYAANLFATWNLLPNIPAIGNMTIDGGSSTGQNLAFCRTGTQVVIVSNQDDPTAGAPPCP